MALDRLPNLDDLLGREPTALMQDLGDGDRAPQELLGMLALGENFSLVFRRKKTARDCAVEKFLVPF